ncbi:MAG: Fur family transcriptional regulator [Lachnospiraceae bacterium]
MKERNTKQKQMILEAVKSRADHPTANQIYFDVWQQDNRISRGTVYRNLNLLSEKGEITDVELSDADRYDYRTDRHYHMLCTVCGEVFDAPVEYQQSADRIIEELTGFQIEGHNTVFKGICKNCSQKKSL